MDYIRIIYELYMDYLKIWGEYDAELIAIIAEHICVLPHR